jgi:SSS family solute:Na+ symporter
MLNSGIHWLDYLIIVLYIISLFIIAFKSGKLSNTKLGDGDIIHEQYMAGKSLTFTESICSIIATEVSALTFLGIPAFAFENDFSFVQIYFGAIFGRFIIAKYFLPKIYDHGLTIYETMFHHGGTMSGRRMVAVFYALNKFLAVGVRLFSGSILIAEFFDLSIYSAITWVAILTFFYTLIGGLKAVVQTDIVQLAIFVTGGIVAHYLIPQVANTPWIDLMEVAYLNGKTNILNFSNPTPFFIGILGGFLFDMSTHGVDQDFVQRLTANRRMQTAQQAIFLSSGASILVGLLFLTIGALLWSHYQVNIVPQGVKPDQLFAYFITNHFPVGFKGFMVAGVLAASMSTLDSTINALSSTFYNDIMPKRDIKKISFYYKVDVFVVTFILMLIAFVASTNDGLLVLGLKIASWTGGSLLACFFGTVLLKKYFHAKLDATTVLGTYILGMTLVALNTYVIKWSWQLNVYFGCFGGLLFQWLRHKFFIKSP